MIDDTINNAIENETEVTETKLPVTPIKKEPEVTDIDLGYVEKKRFRICGDFNRMLELNVSDLNITARLKEGYPKLQDLLKEAQEKILSIPDTDDGMVDLGALADALADIDKKMRDVIDYIFDTNASAVCVPSGNMYDPVQGQFRFERIIEKLSALYSTGLDAEFKALKARMDKIEKKTNKYTKKSKR